MHMKKILTIAALALGLANLTGCAVSNDSDEVVLISPELSAM